MIRTISLLAIVSSVCCMLVPAQESTKPAPDKRLLAPGGPPAGSTARPYVLGPGDQITIWALEARRSPRGRTGSMTRVTSAHLWSARSTSPG